jgi:hypothetical protein
MRDAIKFSNAGIGVLASVVNSVPQSVDNVIQTMKRSKYFLEMKMILKAYSYKLIVDISLRLEI